MLNVRSQPGPFQVMFLCASILAGISLLTLHANLGSTVSRLLPAEVTVLLAAGLVLTGGVALYGTVRQTLVGLLAERSGLLGLGALLLLYAGFTIDYVGLRGLVTVIFFCAISAASWWRVRQIGRSLSDIRAAIREAAPGESER